MIRGRRKDEVRRSNMCNLKPKPARDQQRMRRTVSTTARVKEGGKAQEKEIERRMIVGHPGSE